MKNLYEFVKEFLENENIDTFCHLDAKDLQVINERLMPENIKSAYLWLIPYYTGEHKDRNVSLYALSKDYHIFSKQMANKMKDRLLESFPNDEFYFFCDSSPINEVAAAVKGGLGVIGKNRLLINKKYGSYVFIGTLLTSAEPFADKLSSTNPKPMCLECGKCHSACDFLCGKQNFCYSELNQRKNVTDEELKIIKSKKVRWGCDICQEVCPMNKDVPNTPISFFYEDMTPIVTPELIDEMSKDELSQRAYAWRGKKVIKRNVE